MSNKILPLLLDQCKKLVTCSFGAKNLFIWCKKLVHLVQKTCSFGEKNCFHKIQMLCHFVICQTKVPDLLDFTLNLVAMCPDVPYFIILLC